MRENFDACLSLTLRFEGGFVDHPADPGGATNLGITRATLAKARGHAVSKADMRALTRAEAAEIYRASYWRAVGGDDLQPGVDAVMFDHAVNSGPRAALRNLRNVLHEPADLAQAVRHADPAALVRALCASRRGILQRLRSFAIFGRGWSARISALETAALVMAATSSRASAPTREVKHD